MLVVGWVCVCVCNLCYSCYIHWVRTVPLKASLPRNQLVACITFVLRYYYYTCTCTGHALFIYCVQVDDITKAIQSLQGKIRTLTSEPKVHVCIITIAKSSTLPSLSLCKCTCRLGLMVNQWCFYTLKTVMVFWSN